MVTTYLATSITARLREKEVALFQSERALDLAYREMESLYELGQLVNSTLDVNEVLSLIAENTTRLLNGKACFIRLLDKSGKKLYIGGWHGLSQAYLNKGPVEVEKSLVDAEALARSDRFRFSRWGMTSGSSTERRRAARDCARCSPAR